MATQGFSCPWCGAMDAGHGKLCQHCRKPVLAHRPAGIGQPPTAVRVVPQESRGTVAGKDPTRTAAVIGAVTLVSFVALCAAYYVGTRSGQAHPKSVAQPVAAPSEALPAAADKALTGREIARKVTPSVVMLITADIDGKPIALGSGFFVRDNLIATNHHVIHNAAEVQGKIVGATSAFRIAGVVADNEKDDLSLLQADAFHGESLRLAEDQAAVGDTVYVMGNPEGLEGTFSQGNVSSFREIDDVRRVQISAPISHGSSGGPVVNEKGLVIGVAVSGYETGQNLNFAVPAAALNSLLQQIGPVKPFSGQDAFHIEVDPRSQHNAEADPSAIAAEYVNKAAVHAKEGRYKEAAENLRMAIKAQPNDHLTHYYLGSCLAATESYTEAGDELRTAIRLKPAYAPAHYLLGVLHVIQHDRIAAMQEYETLKALDPGQAKALLDRIN